MILHVIPPEVSLQAGPDDLPKNWQRHYKVERKQRRALWAAVEELAQPNPDDLIIWSDLDEIPRPSVIEKLACVPPGKLQATPICLATKNSFYYYNYRCHKAHEWTDRPKVLPYKKSYGKAPLIESMSCRTTLTNASTHCSGCFDSLEDYVEKGFALSDPYPMVANNTILEIVRSCKNYRAPDRDLTVDGRLHLADSVDLRGIPLVVSKHPERWPHLMMKGPIYDDNNGTKEE
ncbi:hypothetical protein ACHAXT_001858 [Thalassiosira profunda]